MSTTETGQRAEQVASEHLQRQGFTILERNWRTRWCEIDIVAQKGQNVYFVEVKYRRSNNWGSGLEYITPKKLQQMHFAANFWVHRQGWQGDYFLSAMEVSGAQFAVSEWLEDVNK